MKLIIEPSALKGEVLVPASKSHTIRALVIASLAEGESEITNPLDSLDTRACAEACRAFGAKISTDADAWRVTGTAGNVATPADIVDVKNSGTTINFLLSAAALAEGASVLTGDDSIRKRPSGPLLRSLCDLGADAFSTRGDDCPPFVVRGTLRGGKTKLAATSSQYLSSLLIACPLAAGDSEIVVTELNEGPYVQITLDWLTLRGIKYEEEKLRRFRISGAQQYNGFKRQVPGDFSSATFFAVAAAVIDGDLRLLGLDMNDAQGDKEIVHMVEAMGAQVVVSPSEIRIRRGELKGGEFDLNATPDALPAMAVAGALAAGETRLVNVPQARIKETDRIAVMAAELAKMGADVTELEDGLVLKGGQLRGARVNGHHDHRVVMALAVAGLAARGTTVIDTAESAAVTFPNFVELMNSLGASMRVEA